MEDKKLEFHINKNALKNFIASIINKKIGQKLDNLEQKNDTDLKEIKQIIKLLKKSLRKIKNQLKEHQKNQLRKKKKNQIKKKKKNLKLKKKKK